MIFLTAHKREWVTEFSVKTNGYTVDLFDLDDFRVVDDRTAEVTFRGIIKRLDANCSGVSLTRLRKLWVAQKIKRAAAP